jgi:hypothetical protein
MISEERKVGEDERLVGRARSRCNEFGRESLAR